MKKQVHARDCIGGNMPPPFDLNYLYSRLEENTRSGWLIINFEHKNLFVSGYIIQTFHFLDATISFDQFLKVVHPDHTNRILRNLNECLKTKHCNLTFPVRTGDHYKWFQLTIEPVPDVYQPENRGVGILRLIEPWEDGRSKSLMCPEQSEDKWETRNEINRHLLYVLHNPDLEASIHEVLDHILEKLRVDRCYIFTFDGVKRTHSCVCKIHRDHVSSEMDHLKGFPVDTESFLWWSEQLCKGNTLIYEDISALKEPCPLLYHSLNAQSIKSLFILPLWIRGEIWGYIGVDILHEKRCWSEAEKQWFRTLSNYISVCIEIHKTVQTASSSEGMLQKIYRSLPLGIELYAADGAFEDINEIGRSIFYVSDTTAIRGGNLFEHPLLSDSDFESLRHRQKISKDISLDFNPETQRFYQTDYKGKKDLFVKCDFLYGANGEVEHYLMMYIDNTALLDTYHKMDEVKKLFNSVSEFAEVGYYRFDPLKREFYATDQWYKNMSVSLPSPGDHTAHRDEYLSVLHPEDKRQYIRNILKMMRGELASFKQDIRVRDGENWRWLRCENMLSGGLAENGNVIIGLNANITETKRIEKNLTEAKQKAEESDRLKSAFLANMSHEIRTPLNAIVGFSNLLSESDSPEETHEFISIIQQNNDHLLQLIADILDLSKIEAGVFDVTYENIDINHMGENLVNSIRLKAQSGVTVLFEPALAECSLYSDGNRLTQVLSNYLGNAVKFTSQGTIKLSYVIDNEFIEFRVDDTGMGMTQEQVKKVFGRFVKFNTFVQGTGLGLSICKSIARKLNGEVGVDSEPGKGTCFWIRLPYIPGDSGLAQKNELSENETGKNPIVKTESETMTQNKEKNMDRKRILVAEDDDSNALLVAAALRREYDIIRAVNGVEAVAHFRSHQPDLILMDIKMPEMDGLEATSIIRQSNTVVPIIAVTAFAFDSDRERALKIGCTEYLSKPIIPGNLRKVIKQYL